MRGVADGRGDVAPALRLLALVMGAGIALGADPAGAQETRGGGGSPPAARAVRLELPAAASPAAAIAAPVETLEQLRAELVGEPNPYLALLPAGADPDWDRWRLRMELEAQERRRAVLAPALLDAGVAIGESEPNDLPADADPVPGFGTGGGDTPTASLSGTLATAVASGGTSTEDDGAIGLANAPPLGPAVEVSVSAEIGDGPHGSTGSGTGDYDWYEVPILYPGQVILAEVVQPDGSALDPALAVYDSAGNRLIADLGTGSSSTLAVSLFPGGDFYLVVRGFGIGWQSDPFVSGSGPGAASEGAYDLTLTIFDSDFFSVDLEAGDVLGVASSGGLGLLLLHAPDESVLIGSQQDLSGAFPADSPLPGGSGGPVAHLVAPVTGTYTVEMAFGTGAYTADLAVFRPPLESGQAGGRQTLFVDFDGAILDASIFGGPPGPTTLSPLSSFLAGWGLSPADESDVIDAVLAAVEENLDTDLDGSGVNPLFGVRILNSRDHPDPFGVANVSRLVVGGTIAELGIPTIGIAENIDPGNFAFAETAIILLDLLSAPGVNLNSLNQFALDGGATQIELVGVGVGNIVAHEAGHYLGSFHQNRFNATPAIMDQGGDLPNLVGTFDGTFGNGDDVDVDFIADFFVGNEGFFGLEDARAASAFALPFVAAPDVGADPGSVTLGMFPDTQVTVPLEVGNLAGTATLNWGLTEDEQGTCGGVDDVPWLSATPGAGATPAEGAAAVDLDFDSSGLAFDTYTGALCLSSDDPDTPELTIPVELVVSACGPLDLALENASVDGPIAYLACDSITARNGFTVASGAVQMTAPTVVLGDGFTVKIGASLQVTPPAP